jgi:VCBS repeat protein
MAKARWSLSAGVILAIVAGAAGRDEFRPQIQRDPLSSFLVQSYGGKCLDYGHPVHTPPGLTSGPDVYLNDCARAKPIGVEEINDRHELLLHAGAKVLGIRKPPGNALAVGLAPHEFALELQDPADPTGGAAGTDRVFALDGDSIILASSRPCINTDNGGILVAGWTKLPAQPGGPPPCAPPPPQLVVQVQNARGANLSPLVVAPRNLTDSEFWSFRASDGTLSVPTKGFVRVETSEQLWNAICNKPLDQPDVRCENDPTSGWGRVISIEPAEPNGIDLSGYPAIFLPAGITIRGDRRGISMGPQISAFSKKARNSYNRCAACVFQIHGDYVRLTGLRMHGNSRETRHVEDNTIAILVDFPGSETHPLGAHSSLTNFIAMIDRDDISDWEEAAVRVQNGWSDDCDCSAKDDEHGCPVRNDPATLGNIRIERNFLHHNERWSGGYGVNVSGRAVILGNIFLMNRHAIAAGGEPHTEYRAWYNLVLSNVPTYHCFLWECSGFDPDWWKHGSDWAGGMGPQQDFDMHGTGDGGYGGNGGYRVDIAANTFLGGDRPNFELRGHPCAAAYFRSDVSLQGSGDAIKRHNIGDPDVPIITAGPAVPSIPVSNVPAALNSDHGAVKVFKSNNQFRDSSPGYSHPMLRFPNTPADPTNSLLRVGDFDGDGLEDLFLATRTAWYYSPGAVAEWRLLGAKPQAGAELLFGDFDGDGRTDVFTQIGDDWKVSWAGISEWETINHSHWRMTDFYVGDFIGDRRDDVFFARGDQWFVSDAGRGAFLPYATSSFRLPDLAFGHFDSDKKFGNDEKIDVAGVVNHQWMVVYAQDPERMWRPLRPGPAPTTTMKGLIVADFGGTGSSDIASVAPVWDAGHQHVVAGRWKVSRLGRGEWQDLTTIAVSTPFAAVGRFDEKKKNDKKGADILIWHDRALDILFSGTGPAKRHSRQDMS